MRFLVWGGFGGELFGFVGGADLGFTGGADLGFVGGVGAARLYGGSGGSLGRGISAASFSSESCWLFHRCFATEGANGGGAETAAGALLDNKFADDAF